MIKTFLLATSMAILSGSPPVVSSGFTQIAADDFNSFGDESYLADSSNWDGNDVWVTVATGDGRIRSNSLTSAWWVGAGTFTIDQYVTGSLEVTGSGNGVGVVARHQISAETYYSCMYFGTGSSLNLRVTSAGSITDITTTTKSYTTGTKIWLQAIGTGSATRLTVKEDTGSGWVNVFTNVDPGVYLANGKPGVGTQGSGSAVLLNNWSAGTIP